jgi:hypothetical protein
MELLLTVTAGTDRRLTGTARRRDGDVVVGFSGSLELLACLERLCLDGPETPATPSPFTSSPVNEDR